MARQQNCASPDVIFVTSLSRIPCTICTMGCQVQNWHGFCTFAWQETRFLRSFARPGCMARLISSFFIREPRTQSLRNALPLGCLRISIGIGGDDHERHWCQTN